VIVWGDCVGRALLPANSHHEQIAKARTTFVGVGEL